MITFFTPSYSLGTGVPLVSTPEYADGATTFYRGDLLTYSSGKVALAGTNPLGIAGVALQAIDTSPGFQQMNSPTVNTGRRQIVSIANANLTTIFGGKLTSGSSTIVAPATTDVGVEYGVTRYTNIWRVDRAKTGTLARIVITKVDIGNQIVWFRFLASAIAT